VLKALYDYGIQNHLMVPPGFQEKNIHAYICLSQNGKFLGIEQCGKGEKQICPHIGSLSQSPDKCHPLAEKASIVLGNSEKKAEFFRNLLKDGGNKADCLRVCLAALEDKTVFEQIRHEAKLRKLKDGDCISFRVDDAPVVTDAKVQQWWTEYRKRMVDNSSAPTMRCLITGQPTIPLDTLPDIKGLESVGGHPKGVKLFCFDKAAFKSYGLEKAANAPVSEEAFAVVQAAMTDLLAGAPAMYTRDAKRDFNPSAPIYAGMKFLHWYDFSLNPDDDLLMQILQSGDEEEEKDGEEALFQQEEAEEERQQYLLDKKDRADAVVKAVLSGAPPKKLRGEYHVMLISAYTSRAMIRSYEHGSYETLCENLQKWTEDLKLQDSIGTGRARPQKLYTRLTRLMTIRKIPGQTTNDRMKKELAGLTPAIVMAIINGTPLPDAVAVRALAYIRSKLLSAGEKDKKPILSDTIACQWLKVWLIRKRRMKNEEESLMEYYEPGFPNAAYHCGAWLAVYAYLQKAAMGAVNATLVQRFYASASRTPALVFGTLDRMGEVYLDKLRKEKPGMDRIYEEKLNTVCAFFGSEPARQLPTTLNLEGQSYFALGYHQMCTQIIGEIRKRADEKKRTGEEQEG